MSAEEVKARLRPFGIVFEKSLKDLIRGIRAQKDPESLTAFLQQSVADCRQEVKSNDLTMKTTAVLKLSYLEMYGYDMSWCNFHVLEVMSSSKFQQKRVGYLAAVQSFNDPDILMLATNLLKKDLQSSKTEEIGVALSGLATVVTPALAMDVCDDLYRMLNHSKGYVRKKAVAALYKLFMKYPEAIRVDRLVEKLQDNDTSVVSATVTVVCELAKAHPQMFISLSPLLYQMFHEIDINWVIIRLLKMFIHLVAVEPKLIPKLLPEVVELMQKTSAISVIYEAINCISSMLTAEDFDIAAQCLTHLQSFMESQDPNLRYVSLRMFHKIGVINRKFVAEFSHTIAGLLADPDLSIRDKALELVNGDDLYVTVKVLLLQLQEDELPEAYKNKVVNTILKISSAENYGNIPSFEWYIAMLSDLLQFDVANDRVAEHLRNVACKVPSMRELVISKIMEIKKPLKDLIWTLGEFSSLFDNGDEIIRFMVENETLNQDPVVVTSVVKMFASWAVDHEVQIVASMCHDVLQWLETLSLATNYELQERAVEFVEFFKVLEEALQGDQLPMLITDILPSFFSQELKPVAEGSQQRIAIPETLDLDTPFEDFHIESEPESVFEDIDSSDSDFNHEGDEELMSPIVDEVELERRKKAKLENPYYLDLDENTVPEQQNILDEISAEVPKIMEPLVPSIKLKSATKKDVVIISDEVIEGTSVVSSQPKKNVQNMFTSGNMLEKYDFNNKPEVDVEQLRQKLAQQDMDEEIIIVKKKKPKKKKKAVIIEE